MEKKAIKQMPIDLSGEPLLEEAVRIVLDTGLASATLLQRKLDISYTRAARLLDNMEERGIVGPFAGTQPREILVSREQVDLPEKPETTQLSNEACADSDPLLPEAFAAVLAADCASVSVLQRKLRLTYTRAARLMDAMEEKGLVGPYTGALARKILVTQAQWDAMQKPDAQ